MADMSFPIAAGEPLPSGQTRRDTRAVPTGEFRPPRRGEWYLSGAIVEAYRAPNDLTTAYAIARLGGGVLPTPADHEERLTVARRVAGWELGDPTWADVIVAAYLNPEQAAAELERNGA